MTETKEDYGWVQGGIILVCILFVFYGLYKSNIIQILGGLLAFVIFTIAYSGIPQFILENQRKNKNGGEQK